MANEDLIQAAKIELARRELASRSQQVDIPSGPISTAQQIPQQRVMGMPAIPQGVSLGNVIEPAATLASGVAAEPLAGLAGIASLPFGPETAAQNVQATREALTFDPKTQEGLQGLQALGQKLQPVGEALQSAERFTGDIGESIAGPLGGAVGSTLPTAALMAVSAAPVKSALKPIKGTQGAVKRLLGDAAPTSENLKSVARGIYNELDDAGAVVSSGRLDRLGRDLTVLAKRQGLDDTLHPKASAALRKINESKGLDLNLTEIDTLRKVAKASAESIDPSDARLGSMMVEKIDDFLDDLNLKDFTRGRIGDAGKKFKDARQLWQRAKKGELLDDAFEKAKNQASGFENGIRTQFRSLLNNKKKMRGFTPEEKAAMQEVVRGGTAENIAKRLGKLGFGEGQATSMLMGSVGIAGGAAVGGAPGAVAVPLIGTVSRKLAQKLTRNNAEFANQLVRAGQSGKKVVETYLKSVPAKQRDVSELTELLMRPDISLKDLARKAPKMPSKTQKLTADAVFFASFLQSQKDQESGQ